jgi:hypothetical protein
MDQPAQENQTAQPVSPTQPVNAASTKKISWPKVDVAIAMIIAVSAVIVGVYWFFILDKSSSDFGGPVKVATSSAKKATQSAETSASEGDENISQSDTNTTTGEESTTSGWKTYTGKFVQVSFKYPPAITVDEVDGVDTGQGKVNTKIALNDSANNRGLTITEDLLGGFAQLNMVSEKNITVAGVQTKKTYFTNESETEMQAHIQFSKNGKDYYIILVWEAEDAGADEIFDQILATLKFVS